MEHPITGHPSRTTPDFSAHEARERLENRITELAAHIAAATYELLVLIGRYDAERGWVQHGMARQLCRSALARELSGPFGRKRPPTRSTRTATGC